MFFPRHLGLSALDSTTGMQVITLAPANILVCPPLFWPAQQTEASWQAIYRLAYEQLVLAFAPSGFQRAIEPSIN